jgi:hypothetical protein
MKINRFRSTKEQEPGQMVHISEKEALRIICSLSTQLMTKNSNTGRFEFTATIDNETEEWQEYFSIAVDF